MQSLVGGPRSGLTPDRVEEVIRADNAEFSAGAVVLAADGTQVEDISDRVEKLQVASGSFRTVHRTIRVRLTGSLDWTAQRLAPHVTVSDGVDEVTVELGEYLLETPRRVAGEDPQTYTVEGYDLLAALDRPHRETVQITSGTPYLDAVREVVHSVLPDAQVSFTDESAVGALPDDKVWPINPDTSTLNVANELLGAVNYRSLWADWRQPATLRSGPYASPTERPAEWTYDTSADDNIVSAATLTEDTFEVPNRWTFLLDNPTTTEEIAYVVENVDEGPTSINYRGYEHNDVRLMNVSDRAALVTAGDRIVFHDKRRRLEVDLEVRINPLHWHFDVVKFVDDDLGVSGRWQVGDWRFDVEPRTMRLTLRSIS